MVAALRPSLTAPSPAPPHTVHGTSSSPSIAWTLPSQAAQCGRLAISPITADASVGNNSRVLIGQHCALTRPSHCWAASRLARRSAVAAPPQPMHTSARPRSARAPASRRCCRCSSSVTSAITASRSLCRRSAAPPSGHQHSSSSSRPSPARPGQHHPRRRGNVLVRQVRLAATPADIELHRRRPQPPHRRAWIHAHSPVID